MSRFYETLQIYRGSVSFSPMNKTRILLYPFSSVVLNELVCLEPRVSSSLNKRKIEETDLLQTETNQSLRY